MIRLRLKHSVAIASSSTPKQQHQQTLHRKKIRTIYQINNRHSQKSTTTTTTTKLLPKPTPSDHEYPKTITTTRRYHCRQHRRFHQRSFVPNSGTSHRFTALSNVQTSPTFYPFEVSPQGARFATNTAATTTINNNNDDGNVCSSTTEQLQDVFGEPVTFLCASPPSSYHFNATNDNNNNEEEVDIQTSMLALDKFTMAYLSRGNSVDDGGDELGPHEKAAHSSAIVWADFIRISMAWCHPCDHDDDDDDDEGGGETKITCGSPMLLATAFSPILAQTGSAYLCHLSDSYLFSPHTFPVSSSSDSSSSSSTPPPPPNLFQTLQSASQLRHSPNLSPRERFHLLVLHYLLNNDHRRALATLHELLEVCPGDALGLSLAMDVANVVGDGKGALRAATSVAAYWNERNGRTLPYQNAMSRYAVGSSLVAVGYAMGGRVQEAEQLVERTKRTDTLTSPGLVAWCLSHIYRMEGRISEGVSKLSNSDGVQSFEKCGFLFFDSILGGYGARFVLDRDGSRADQVAIRFYDEKFGRVLEQSGYKDRRRGVVLRGAPGKRSKKIMKSMGTAAEKAWGGLWGMVTGRREEEPKVAVMVKEDEEGDKSIEKTIASVSVDVTMEDVLSWMPPTTQLLTEATLVLFRLTINGALYGRDERWQDLRVAWEKLLAIERRYATSFDKALLGYAPMSRIAVCIALKRPFHKQTGQNSDGGDDNDRTVSGRLEKAAELLSHQMQIGQETIDPLVVDDVEGWKQICTLLLEARSGWSKCPSNIEHHNNHDDKNLQPLTRDFEGLSLDLHDFMEHAICHAALNSGDDNQLFAARSVCSESVVMRSGSPETWWRYGLILEKLGDHEAAADARAASVSFGSGEGGEVTIR